MKESMKKIRLTVSSTYFCQEIVSRVLIEQCSTGFAVEPLPDDNWCVTYKIEHDNRVRVHVGWFLQAFPKETATFEESKI